MSSDHLLEASGSASTTLPSPTSSSKLLTPPSTSPIATPQSNAAKEDWTAGLLDCWTALQFCSFWPKVTKCRSADWLAEETVETRLSVQVEIPKSAEVEEMKASDIKKKLLCVPLTRDEKHQPVTAPANRGCWPSTIKCSIVACFSTILRDLFALAILLPQCTEAEVERLRQELQRQYALKERSAENLRCEFNVNI